MGNGARLRSQLKANYQRDRISCRTITPVVERAAKRAHGAIIESKVAATSRFS
jgi:hypothetical protein